MKKTIYRVMSVVLTFTLILGVYGNAGASPLQVSKIYYVSSAGSDSNGGTATAPLKTLQAAATKTVAGDVIILLAGSYTGSMTLTDNGDKNNPIIIRGEGAVFNESALTVKNSQWLIFENITFNGGVNQVTLQNSHYLNFRNNVFDYQTRGIYIQEYSSHILVEKNEFTQTCSKGKNWTQLKGSTCEGGGVYGSSYGGGSYYIRNNWVHDVFNGFIFSDDTAGQWMNANVFIYSNLFERVVDDPAEPEGDSVNFHLYNNTMYETHRMISLTTQGLGPVFVYNNLQITKGNPTNEASRLNSAFKIDLSGGFQNGVWIFNNTIVGETAANFYAYDMLSRTITTPLTVRNNIYVTKLNAFNKTPSGGSLDYDISKAAFGMTQPHGIVGDPLVLANGKLSTNSIAIGKSTQVSIPNWFNATTVIANGTNLGAFQTVPAPAWVTPPNYPSQIPAQVTGWVDFLSMYVSSPVDNSTPTAPPTATYTLVPTVTAGATLSPASPTATKTLVPTVVPSATSLPVSPTAVIPTDTSQTSSGVFYDDTDPAFVYSAGWIDETYKRKAYGGTFKSTTEGGSFATFAFTGQSFSILYTSGPIYRNMDVYVDDVLVGTIDQKTGTRIFQQRWDYSGNLTLGVHTLKLVFVSDRSDKKGSIDAVIVR